MGFSATAMEDTTMEHTKHKNTAIRNVFAKLSLSNLATSKSPFDVGLHDEVIEQGCEQVAKQDGKHHAFRKRGINHANQHTHESNEDAVEPSAIVGHRRRYRVRRHEHRTEGETAQHQVPVERHGKHRIGQQGSRVFRPKLLMKSLKKE